MRRRFAPAVALFRRLPGGVSRCETTIGLWGSGDPATVFQPRVTAAMVDVQMGADTESIVSNVRPAALKPFRATASCRNTSARVALSSPVQVSTRMVWFVGGADEV